MSIGIQWALLNQLNNNTEAYKMTAQDGVQIGILVFVALLWMNLKMMGVI